MRPGRDRYHLAAPLALSLLLLCARLFPAAALVDPVSGAAPAALHLRIPGTYLILAPLFTVWDGVSMLSMSRLKWLVAGLALLYVIWRALRVVSRTGQRQSI